MTTGDEEAESLVDNLFREVDDQFKDLEREYQQARDDLAGVEAGRRDTPSDALEASNERFELMSRVASLQAELSRRADELDERDRLLGELSDQIAGFEADIAARDTVAADLRAARHEAQEARREQARLQALLDARAAERHELAEVAQRLQNERDHVQDLLTTALQRFEQVEAVRLEMDNKLRHLEAARDTAAREHEARAHELIESRAEMSRLSDQVAELHRLADEATERADKAEALAERRSSEAGYLNRRIEALSGKVSEADQRNEELAELRRTKTLADRRVTELERELAALRAEADASAAAVEAIAQRTSDYDELVERITELEQERDDAWEAASAALAAPVAGTAAPARSAAASDSASGDLATLAERARELGARRTATAAPTTAAPEAAAPEAAAPQAGGSDDDRFAEAGDDDQLEDLDETDAEIIDRDLDTLLSWSPGEVDPHPLADHTGAPTEPPGRVAVPRVVLPDTVVEFDGTEAPAEVVVDAGDEAEAQVGVETDGESDADAAPMDGLRGVAAAAAAAEAASLAIADAQRLAALVDDAPVVDAPAVDAPAVDAPVVDAPVDGAPQFDDHPGSESQSPGDEEVDVEERAPGVPIAEPEASEHSPEVEVEDVGSLAAAAAAAGVEVEEPVEGVDSAPQVEVPTGAAVPGLGYEVRRKRAILPAELVPNTPEAVSFLLSQPGLIAIIDARSTCGRTGLRPSELFERAEQIRDHFDVPIEIVVTPVSTPVGGAPDLPAVGVHHVTGADTVADRVRGLCMGFPADQPLVVIAGDDHVRRAAIGEGANVVDPSAVLEIAAG